LNFERGRIAGTKEQQPITTGIVKKRSLSWIGKVKSQ
jgi:hypothetical protein